MSRPDEPRVVTTRGALRDALGDWVLRSGPGGRRTVVMTMGALHDGHLELVRRARELAGNDGQVVVTIFVNPLQFGAGEDLDRYPRDLAGDVSRLAGVGADLVFAPAPEVVYPGGEPTVRVGAGPLGNILEGASRPGHFDGVLTVVLKLMHLVRPEVAVFGEKDAQQLAAIRAMVAALDVDVEIVGVPIVRDADGLALSSRNAYLTTAQRSAALALSGALRAAGASASAGHDAAEVLAAAGGMLAGATGVEVDYLVLADPVTLDPVDEGWVGPAHLLVAARVGTTRLIDNAVVQIAPSDGGDL